MEVATSLGVTQDVASKKRVLWWVFGFVSNEIEDRSI
jgi:hypothetical protein